MTTPDELLAAAQAEQATEWGTYVATVGIDIAGAHAFNPGDPVPVSHVEKFGLQDQVERVAESVTPPEAPAEPAPAPVEEV